MKIKYVFQQRLTTRRRSDTLDSLISWARRLVNLFFITRTFLTRNIILVGNTRPRQRKTVDQELGRPIAVSIWTVIRCLWVVSGDTEQWGMVASGAGQVSHTKCSACKWHWVSHFIVIKTVLFIARGSRGFLEELRGDLHWLTPPHPLPPLLWNICRHKRVEGSNLSQSVSRSALFQRTHRLVLKKTKTTNQNKTNNLFRLLFFFIVEKYFLHDFHTPPESNARPAVVS